VNIKLVPLTDSKLKKEAIDEYIKSISISLNIPSKRTEDANKAYGEAYSKINKTPSGEMSKMIKKILKLGKTAIEKAIRDNTKVSVSEADVFTIESGTPCILIVTDKNPFFKTNSEEGALSVYDTNNKPIQIRVGGSMYSLIVTKKSIKSKMIIVMLNL